MNRTKIQQHKTNNSVKYAIRKIAKKTTTLLSSGVPLD